MFHAIGCSRFVHFDGSETTRSRPVSLCRHAWITELSAAPVDASVASAPALASTATAAASASNRVRETRKTWGMNAPFAWAFSGSRPGVPCL